MRPQQNLIVKINSVEVVFSAIHSVWTLCSCIYQQFKDTMEEKYLKRVFQNHLALFPRLFTIKLYVGRSMNALVFFFAALAEVQVAVLSVGWFSNRTGTSFNDGKARGKDYTRLPVHNLPLSHWSSQLFYLRATSSTDVPVLLLNQPGVQSSTERFSSHLSNRALLCLQRAVICLRNALRFDRRFANVSRWTRCLETQAEWRL